jgi:hypothetical protein
MSQNRGVDEAILHVDRVGHVCGLRRAAQPIDEQQAELTVVKPISALRMCC